MWILLSPDFACDPAMLPANITVRLTWERGSGATSSARFEVRSPAGSTGPNLKLCLFRFLGQPRSKLSRYTE